MRKTRIRITPGTVHVWSLHYNIGIITVARPCEIRCELHLHARRACTYTAVFAAVLIMIRRNHCWRRFATMVPYNNNIVPVYYVRTRFGETVNRVRNRPNCCTQVLHMRVFIIVPRESGKTVAYLLYFNHCEKKHDIIHYFLVDGNLAFNYYLSRSLIW